MSFTHMFARPCDNQQCARCLEQIRKDEDGAIIAVPKDRVKRLSAKTLAKFIMKWDLSKSAEFFHVTCWEEVYNNPKITDTELRVLNAVLESLEKYESVWSLRQKMPAIASLFRESKHTVCFTGAGISVSSGIPTYRGANGIDTFAEHSTEPVTKKQKKVEPIEVEEEEDIDYVNLRPTLGHRCLASLHANNMMHYCITQNCDDLHNKGGFPRVKMSELHGNVFIEYCEKCLKEYCRDYCVDLYSTDCYEEEWYVRCHHCKHNHFTGRVCGVEKCGGRLRDTIVNFGDLLHEEILGGLGLAEREAKKAEVCLCLGSSLTVSPANTLPTKPTHLIIVNPGSTDLDNKAHHRLWGACDTFFALLFEQLALPLPAME